MSDEEYEDKPLPVMIEKKCELCGRTTLVAKDYRGPVFCIEHDPNLEEEIKKDGI